MKKIALTAKILFLLSTCAFLFLNSCAEDEKLNPVNSISVSQGTYIGVVHITWPPVTDAGYYNIQRMGPDGTWMGAGTVTEPPFDDYGFGLPDNKLVEGARYIYRISSASADVGDSPYSDPSGEGWIYECQAIELQATRQNDGTVSLVWNDPNLSQAIKSNVVTYYYKIMRRYEGETSYQDIHTTNPASTIQNFNYTDGTVANDKKAFYKIQGWYNFEFKNMDWGLTSEYFMEEYPETEESGGASQSNYTITQLNSFPRLNNGCEYVFLKNIENEMYAATLAKPVLGNPIIYKLSGSTWQNISTGYPAGLLRNFKGISICGDGTSLWTAGVADSAYIYAYNSGWSSNLAPNNLGLGTVPDHLQVEYAQNNLYALCSHDKKIDVYTYTQNGAWNLDTVLDDGISATDLVFKKYNNTLYCSYLIINSESNSTLRIKHLEGSNWITDFDASYDNIMNVKISVDNSGNIYFTADYQNPTTLLGNVYKVTSPSTADKMIDDSNSWFIYPLDIDFDNLGNPVALYGKIISQSSPIEMHLAVYENNGWKDIAGDFSNFIGPADIESKDDLYFVFGDGSDVVNGYPATLNALKLNK